MDAFNPLNVQGYNNPNATDGAESMLSFPNRPPQTQLTLRLALEANLSRSNPADASAGLGLS